jgi:hypothetical protein
MTHTTYFWVIMNTNMVAFLECGYGFDVEMDGSTLIELFEHTVFVNP